VNAIKTHCHHLQDNPFKKVYLENESSQIMHRRLWPQLDPQVRAVFEKLIAPQFIKKFSLFYEPWRFVILFTRTHHLSHMLGQINPISHSIYSKSIFILPFHICLRVPSGLLPSGLAINTLYAPILFSIHLPCRTPFDAGTLTREHDN